MRDIKFRGKRVDNGEWVYSNSIEINGNPYLRIAGKIGWEWHEVDPTTIGQFTGLTDRNGVEIFEGDRIKIYTDQLPGEYKLQKEMIVCEIEWESGAFHAINHETEDQFPLWQIDTSTTELIHDKELKE